MAVTALSALLRVYTMRLLYSSALSPQLEQYSNTKGKTTLLFQIEEKG